jgi:hypothetical protein
VDWFFFCTYPLLLFKFIPTFWKCISTSETVSAKGENFFCQLWWNIKNILFLVSVLYITELSGSSLSIYFCCLSPLGVKDLHQACEQLWKAMRWQKLYIDWPYNFSLQTPAILQLLIKLVLESANALARQLHEITHNLSAQQTTHERRAWLFYEKWDTLRGTHLCFQNKMAKG